MLAIALTKTEFFIHTFIYIVIYYVTHIIVDFFYDDSVVRMMLLGDFLPTPIVSRIMIDYLSFMVIVVFQVCRWVGMRCVTYIYIKIYSWQDPT